MIYAFFGLLLLFFIVRMPIAFAMGSAAAIAMYFFFDVPLTIAVQQMFTSNDSFPLLAVPFFMLAGALMESGGISRRLVNDENGVASMTPSFLGEFEQMVLLSILQLDEKAFAVSVLRELDDRAGRQVSRGALYKTLERLEEKGMVSWEVEDATPDRGGHPRRLFRVTGEGVMALRASREALFRLWDGLEGVLEGKGR